jgi:hypothetical protein
MSLAHHSLVAWQRADDLFIKLHQLSLKAFPEYERFELGGQLRRASFSAVKQVGAPLAGLITSTRLKLSAKTGVAVLLVAYVTTRLV